MKNKKAFTLVELIVVITIITILGIIAFISLQGYSKSSRDSVRISDMSNMKTSLELFHLNSGKYPMPDGYYTADYDTEDLWYQGQFGSTVVSNLSKNLNEIPTDPLTDREYIYSVANNKNEYEILTLLEGELTQNNILNQITNKTNAANIIVTPRIDGTYNGVFVKTTNYIVPIPSIINTEVDGSNLTLNSINITSQILTNYDNIPNYGNINYNTGALSNLKLSVYTGTITSDSTDTDKEEAMLAIQAAYTGSEVITDEKISYILSKITTEELVALTDTIILKNTKTVKTEQQQIPNPYESCIGQNNPTPFSATTTYTGCDTADIIVCAGTGSGYTISACNLGVTIASTDWAVSGGDYFQWGRNKGFPYGDTSQQSTIIDGNIGLNAGTDTYGFVYNTTLPHPYSWANSDISNNWGDITNTRQGPCGIGYHLPTISEWTGIITAGEWITGADMQTALKLPYSGRRSRDISTYSNVGSSGLYWTSSLNGISAYNILFNSTVILNTYSYHAWGYTVRCFKN